MRKEKIHTPGLYSSKSMGKWTGNSGVVEHVSSIKKSISLCIRQPAFVDFADIFLQKKKGREGRTVKPCASSGFWVKEALLCLIKGAGGSLARKAHFPSPLEK